MPYPEAYMGEIKTAAQIAQEKLEKIGGATQEERLRWKYMPEGEKLAARYLKEEVNLAGELGKFEKEAAKYVIAAASDILIRNIMLPRNEVLQKTNEKVMDGLKTIKTDKVAAENIFNQIRYVLDHFMKQGEQQKKQAYESLKADFEERIQQAMRQRTGMDTNVKINVEQQPQFLEEWQRLLASMDAQYTKRLDEYKQALAVIK